MRNKLIVRVLTAGVCLSAGTLLAQTTNLVADATATQTAVGGFLVGVAEGYPWLATVLLAVGALRVVFKPLMTLIDGYIKNNCTADEYAKLQTFESGPVYKWVSFALDLVGSVKLPVIGVKPSPTTTETKS